PLAYWRCAGSASTGYGGSSRPAIRWRVPAGVGRLSARAAPARAPATPPAPPPHPPPRPRARAGPRLYLRDRVLPGAALPRRALRLDHGRRQSAQLPSLAALARHRRPGADRRRRPAWAQPLRDGQRRGAGAGALSRSRSVGKEACGTQAAGLDLSARPQIAAVIDGAARRPRAKTSLNDS